jgi:hypothetical protein
MDTMLPSKTEAIVTLMIAIENHHGNHGPGCWVIDSGKSFIALTWIFDKEHIPKDSTRAEGLWKLYGGEEILSNSRLEPENIVIKLSGQNKFMSAIIPVRD